MSRTWELSVTLTLLLLASLLAPARAEAETPASSGPDTDLVETEPLPAPSAGLKRVWAEMPPVDLLQAAIDRRSLGDVQGARDRLLVLDDGAALPEAATYHLAVCDELEEDYIAALAGYSTIVDAWPDGAFGLDAMYRRAIVLEDIGDHRAAVAQIKELQRLGHWTPMDAWSMALVRGAAEVRAGRQRRGVRRIQRTLDELAGTPELTWARARARMALAEMLFSEAEETEIVNDRKARKRLVERVGHLDGAMDQVVAISQLGEPEYALDGLLALGDAYVSLHDDLVAAPPPRKLDDEQVRIFRSELSQQVEVLEVKAWRFYDEGVSLATRLRWQGQTAEVLKARRDGLGVEG